MSDFRPLTMGEVVARLREPRPTLVLFHKHPDADAVGSGFALCLWLDAMGSPARCVCADEVPEHLQFLTAGLQESVLLSAIPAGFEDARVITVDTASPAQVGSLFETFEGRIELMIDHHGRGEPYADYLVMPEAAASGEIVFDLIAASGVDVQLRVSELLYAAISADTGSFRHSNTTKETHLHAAALVGSGIDTAEINRQLYESKSFENLKAEKAGFDRLHLYDGGRVAILTFPFALQRELGVKEEHLGTLVDVARCIRGVEVAVALRETAEENTYRASLRANVDFDVSAVAAHFGGGGHVRAAGATVIAPSAEEAERLLWEEILRARK